MSSVEERVAQLRKELQGKVQGSTSDDGEIKQLREKLSQNPNEPIRRNYTPASNYVEQSTSSSAVQRSSAYDPSNLLDMTDDELSVREDALQQLVNSNRFRSQELNRGTDAAARQAEENLKALQEARGLKRLGAYSDEELRGMSLADIDETVRQLNEQLKYAKDNQMDAQALEYQSQIDALQGARGQRLQGKAQSYDDFTAEELQERLANLERQQNALYQKSTSTGDGRYYQDATRMDYQKEELQQANYLAKVRETDEDTMQMALDAIRKQMELADLMQQEGTYRDVNPWFAVNFGTPSEEQGSAYENIKALSAEADAALQAAKAKAHNTGADWTTLEHYAESQINKERADAMTENAKNTVEDADSIVGAMLRHSGSQIFGGLGALDMTAQAIGNAFRGSENYLPIDPNTNYNRYSILADAYQQGGAELVEKYAAADPILGKFLTGKDYITGDQSRAQYLYNVGVSSLDSAVNLGVAMLLSAGISGFVPMDAQTFNTTSARLVNAIMGSSAATSAIRENLKSGDMTDAQAVTLGIMSGVAEAITESWSIETLLNGDTTAFARLVNRIVKNPVGNNLLKGFISEGSEEIASNWLNRLFDYIVRHDKSETMQDYNAYLSQGDSSGEAWRKIFAGWLQEDASAGLAGSLAGLTGGASHYALTGTVDSVDTYVTEREAEKARLQAEQNARQEAQNVEQTAQQNTAQNVQQMQKKTAAQPTAQNVQQNTAEQQRAENTQQERPAANNTEAQITNRNRSEAEVDSDILQVARAATVLGESGAKALTDAYDRATAQQISPEEAVTGFTHIYNAALENKDIPSENLPAHMRMAAEYAGQNDAARAAQAKYFGASAMLVRDKAFKNAHLSSRTAMRLDALAKVLGVKIRFAEEVNNGLSNAAYGDGEMVIALDTQDPLNTAVIHEAIHRLRETNPKLYNELSTFIQTNLSTDRYLRSILERMDRYQNSDLGYLTEEMVADAFGRIMKDGKLLDRYVQDNRTGAEKLRDLLQDIVNAVRRVLNQQNLKLSREQKAEFQELEKQYSAMAQKLTKALDAAARQTAEQNKNAANEAEVKTKFSMKSYVEETKNLLALHNLTEKNLLDAAKLGGLPMPSIAIVKADAGHGEYGDISFVFSKDTIDPQRSRANKVYGYDAWTPTAPQVEYEVNEKAASKIRDLFNRMQRGKGRSFAEPLYSVANTLEDELNRKGGVEKVVAAMRDDTRVMNIYLEDTGRGAVDNVIKREVKRMDDNQQELASFLIRELGDGVVNDFRPKGNESPIAARKLWYKEHGEALNTALQKYYEKLGLPAKDAADVVNAEPVAAKTRYLLDARKFLDGNTETVTEEVDRDATNKAIRDKVDKKEYDRWLDNLFDGIVKNEGIYNGKDYYTPSGNRRSFSATHYEITLENIVKAMKQGDQKGTNTFFGGQAIWGVASKDYNSISDIKKDSGRLQKMTEDEYSAIRQEYTERFAELANEIKDPSARNEFIASDDAATAIVDTLRTKHTEAAIDKELRTYHALQIKPDTAKKVFQLYKDISNMPTGYFEAKPQRAVGFDEVLAAVIPNDASAEVKEALENAGVRMIEYASGDEKARLDAVNSVDGARFSLKRTSKMTLNEQLKMFYDGKMASSDAFYFGETPIKLKNAGFDVLPLAMTIRDFRKSTKKKHNIPRRVLKNLMGNLASPLFSFGSGEKAGIVLDDIDGDGYKLLAALERGTNMDRKPVNVINSLYGLEHPAEWLKNQIDSGSEFVLYDEKRANAFLQTYGYKASVGDGIRSLDETVTQEKESVKRKNSKEEIPTEELLAELVKRYGAMPTGENPFRDIVLPKKTAKELKLSQTVRTILEAKATPEVMVPSIQELAAEGTYSYQSYSDEAALSDAEAKIRDVGWGKALEDWNKAVRSGEVSKANTAMGWALYDHSANSGDTATALMVLNNMVEHQRSAAQAVQATRILKQMNPETQLYGVQRSVANLQKEINERYGKKGVKLIINEDLAERFMKAETQTERDNVLADIYRDIGRQMPSSFMDKWNAWRYLSMLGNPRTHVRNIVGNAGFVPVVAVKNLTATGIEAAVNFVSRGQLQRTKGLIGFSSNDRAILKAAWNDYAKIEEAAMGGGKYSDYAAANKYVEEGRRIFRLKGLEWLRKTNGKLLDQEDVWFSQPHYANALAQYCKANHITAEQIAEGGTAMKNARAYAILEAQKATYRDTNAFSQAISDLGRVGFRTETTVNKAIAILTEGILPFRKTPANILVRGIEYSPIGLMWSIKQGLVDVKSGEKTGAQVIDGISAGLTGTGLAALGFYLASQLLVRGGGGDDDKKKNFEKLTGHQTYSLELPDGTSIKLDWLAPECMPFFIGVNLYETMRDNQGDLTMADMLSAITQVSEPWMELSCMQSLNSAFEAVGSLFNSGVTGLPKAVINAATSYFTQGLPTLLGQVERTLEEQRYTTYTEKNAFLTRNMQDAFGKASARIPGVDFQQIPYIDAWGRIEYTGDLPTRALNNFLNPAYTSKISTSDAEKELFRLYDVTGEEKVFPKRPDKYFKANGEFKYLTAEEYVKYATLKGQKSLELVTNLTKSDAYKKMSDEQKVDAIVNAYTLANQIAKTKISSYKPEAWVQNAIDAEKSTGVKMEAFLIAKVKTAGLESINDKNGKAIVNSKGLLIMQQIYSIPGLTDKQRAALFESLGVGKEIRHLNKAAVDEKLQRIEKKNNK